MKIINHDVKGLQLSQRHDEGYLNLTQMAKANNKLIADYLRFDTTKAFIDKLSTVMGIPISGKNGLIQIRKGGNNKNTQGTYWSMVKRSKTNQNQKPWTQTNECFSLRF